MKRLNMRLLFSILLLVFTFHASAQQMREPLQIITRPLDTGVRTESKVAVDRSPILLNSDALTQVRVRIAFDQQPVLVRFALPDGNDWLALIKNVSSTYSGGFAYTGEVPGIAQSMFVLVDNAGVVSLQVSAISQAFSAEGNPIDGYFIRKVEPLGRQDHPRPPPEVLPQQNVVPGVRFQMQSDAIEVARDDGSIVDVMVVYTPTARSQNGGVAQINANIDAQIALTNTIYANSNVVQRLRLVYRGEVNYTEVNMDTDLPRLRSASDGFMDEVPILRDIYKADFVSLWGGYSDYCGLGYIMASESASFESSAYNIVASPSCTAANSYTFAHELGHNMGLRHDNYVDAATTSVTPEAGGSSTTISYAHGYIDLTNRFRTVMSYNDQCVAFGFGCTRIPHFSNPAVSFNNSASYPSAMSATTGNAASAHERQALNDTRETTSNFRQAVASLTGPGLLTFLAPSASVAEGAGVLQVLVARHLGTSGAISVNYATGGGTATGNVDYTTVSGTLSWADGDASVRVINIPISQDAPLEGPETFSLTLSAPSGGATVGSASSLMIRILDDEVDTFPPSSSLPPGFLSPDNPPVPTQTNTPTTVWSFEANDGYLSNTSLRSAQIYSASGDFTNFRNSDLEFSGIFVAGTISFAYKVSSYSSFYGALEFMIDNVVVLTSAGGETGWVTASVPITAGQRLLRWRFKNRLPFACASAIPAPPGGANCADRAWVDSIFLPLATVPASPTSVSAARGGSAGQVTVSFTAPSNNGGTSITGYTASCSASGQVMRTWTGAGSPITVSGLNAGVVYTCTVSATNSVGTGTASAASNSVTPAGIAKPADLDGDGKSDLILRHTDGRGYLWLMNGLSVAGGTNLLSAGSGWSVTHTGD
ncbi:MAG: Calx-beta domain-containing protein, partial [Burkholderiales bacterium]